MSGDNLDHVRSFLREDDPAPEPLGDADTLFGQIAIARGYVSTDHVMEASRSGGGLERALLDRGWITPEQCRDVRERLRKLVTAGEGRRTMLGRYEIVREIARGGMGIVYEARDPGLKRSVAVKVLKSEFGGPSITDRFRREAAIMAKLRHPNIVPVHDIGTVVDAAGERRYFIASDYIDGATLAETLPALDRRQRIRVLEIVARAVGHAHAQGIVHRDLKAQNILMEKNDAPDAEALPWRVFLTDFGLSRDLTADDVTRSGPVVGTAHVMAPEQARGQASLIGPWTDVWSLGVMLYELVTDAKPFPGASAPEVYEKILRDDPTPPRAVDRTVPRDIDTICLKSLQKDPTQRYANAVVFADELGRYLAGESIVARPPGMVRRIGKIVRRHPVAVGVSLGLAVIAVVVGLFALAQREDVERERERTESALREVEWRRTIDDALRPAVVLLDRWELEGTILSGEDRAVAEASIARAEAIRSDAGPCRLERGRWKWMTGDLAEAEADMTAAATDPPVKFLAHYYRARIALERYSRNRLTSPAIPYAGEVRVLYEKISVESSSDRALVERALADLDEFGRRVGAEDQRTRLGRWLATRYRASTAAEFAAAGAALIDAAERGGNVSRRLASDAAGEAFYYAGDFVRAAGIHRETIAKLGDDGRTRFLLGLAALACAYKNYWAGKPSEVELTEAVDAFRRATELNPSSPAAWADLGYARIQRGMVDRMSGKDPSEVLAAAVVDQTSAIERAPRFAGAWNGRALARLEMGLYLQTMRKDPRAALEQAVADCTRALAIEPDYILALANRGNARLCLAQFLIGAGKDPTDIVKEAIRDQTRVVEIEPTFADGWNDRGNARLLLAHMTICRNEDAEPTLNDAVGDFGRAIARNATYAYSWSNRGIAHSMLAEFRQSRGRDPAEARRAAEEDFTKAIALKPDLGGAYFNRALLYVKSGRWEAAKKDFEQVVLLNPALRDKCAPYLRQCLERIKN